MKNIKKYIITVSVLNFIFSTSISPLSFALENKTSKKEITLSKSIATGKGSVITPLTTTANKLQGNLEENPSDYTFPRLSLGSFWLQDWLNKPGYGFNFLTKFEEIYTYSSTEEIVNLRQRAAAEGYQDWLNKVKIIFMHCFLTTKMYTQPPADWEIDMARNNIGVAVRLAAYYNLQNDSDWFLRDIQGNTIAIWSPSELALNTTPDCPLGTWDGKARKQNGQLVDTGLSTVGLTYYQWLAGPITQRLIRNSSFKQAFDGIQSEDFPSAWAYYSTGKIPDPRRDRVGFPNQQDFANYCRDTWLFYSNNFIKPLKNEMITRLNGHALRWRLENWPENPHPEIQESFKASKLENFGNWGGWPGYDLPRWVKVYISIEENYHPLSSDPNDPAFDSQQGWDITSVQSEPYYGWTQEDIARWTRFGLSATLLGDGFFFGNSYMEDYYFASFLRGNQSQFAPRFIPQQLFHLGKAQGDYMQYNYYPNNPVYYRQFFDEALQKTYTVACNPWHFRIKDVPAKDGVWFEGDWPNGQYTELFTGGAPRLLPIPDQRTKEGNILQFNITATSPNPSEEIVLTASGVPFSKGARFNDNGDNTGNFSWTPGFNDAGTYEVVFRATNPGGLSEEKSVVITVENVNLVPSLKSRGGIGK
ncbi:MAG: hypothetical protein HQL27_05505 [Candidatus Omnitrophica bacterium]|nr:hypothetical protein [Candidatus Omnitrophota bacterium]